MRIKRPAILFLSASILGIIIAVDFVSIPFKLILLTIAIFLYGKLFFDGKLYSKTLIVVIVFGLLGFCRFKTVQATLDRYVANAESLGRGNKVIIGSVETIGKSTNSNYFILDNCFSNGVELGKCRCYFNDELGEGIKIGNKVRVTGGISVIEAPSNEGEFNQKNYYRSDNITFIAFANNIEVTSQKFNILRQKIYEIKVIIKSQIQKIFDEKDAGLFSAMITGDKSNIDREQKRRFSDNGIAHILAISGLHLSILGLALFELLRKKLSVNVSAGFVSVFILLYGIFIDAGASSLRAISMLFVRFLSLSIGRTYDSKNTLYIIGFIFIMLRPYLLFNAGFQFSYVAIYALNAEVSVVKIDKKIHHILGMGDDKLSSNIDDNVIVGVKVVKKRIPAVIILTLFLFPVTVYHYFTYPLYSILINLIVIPLMAFVLGFGIVGLGLSFLYVPLGKILSFVVHWIFILYDKLCALVEFLPANILVIGKPNLYEMIYYYIILFLIILIINNNTDKILMDYKYEKKNNYKNNVSDNDRKILVSNKYRNKQLIKILLCIFALIFSAIVISIRNPSEMRMTFISIGQGDSILIESKEHILTIDGGSSSNTSNGQYILSPHIKSRAIGHIDYAFITHADSDHTNGIVYLLDNENEIKIYNLVLPITATDDVKFEKLKKAANNQNVNIVYMKEGDIHKFKDNYHVTVLSPNEGSLKSKKRDENEMSLTFRLDYNNHSALFTGDIGKETMNRMLKNDFAIKNMDVEVLKVPHHGSKNSNVPEFFDTVSPKYSVFSYGKYNNYGHPNQNMVEYLDENGSVILKTAERGQIDIYFDKENIYYHSYR